MTSSHNSSKDEINLLETDLDRPLDIPFMIYGMGGCTPEEEKDLREAMQRLVTITGGAVNSPDSFLYAADSMIVLGRQSGFKSDPYFRVSTRAAKPGPTQRGLAWRSHVLCWAAAQALNVEGHFVECGCGEGYHVDLVARYHNLGKTDRRFYAYDLFDLDPLPDYLVPDGTAKPDFDYTQARLAAHTPYVELVRGVIPDCLQDIGPERIAYLHLDMNSCSAESEALDILFPRMSQGGIVIFDDYGWQAYHNQSRSHDAFAERYNLSILESPTGQGILIKA